MFRGSHAATILDTLNSDRQDRDSFCDVTLVVDGKKFKAHRCILAKLSPYFNRMFKSKMKETYDNTINIEAVSSNTMEVILEFFYTANVKIVEENVLELLIASDYFQLDELKSYCARVLVLSLTVFNCLYRRYAGKMYNCKMLVDGAQAVVVKKFKKIIKQSGFVRLSADDLTSVIQDIDQKAIGSKAVYEGIISWVNYDVEQRKGEFSDLLRLVSLDLLPSAYLEEKVVNNDLVKSSIDCKDYLLSELLYIMKQQKRKEPIFESSSSDDEDTKDLKRQYTKLRHFTSQLATPLNSNLTNTAHRQLHQHKSYVRRDSGCYEAGSLFVCLFLEYLSSD